VFLWWCPYLFVIESNAPGSVQLERFSGLVVREFGPGANLLDHRNRRIECKVQCPWFIPPAILKSFRVAWSFVTCGSTHEVGWTAKSLPQDVQRFPRRGVYPRRPQRHIIIDGEAVRINKLAAR
jgi:hypothetical protein